MEGTLMIKTYRGLLADGDQDKIRLTTTDGLTGYRITKFQLMFYDAVTSIKSVVQIWKTEQDAVSDVTTGIVNFEKPELLAAAMLSGKADQTAYPEDLVVVFDSELFNQDIFITHSEIAGVAAVNYYIELEKFKLSTVQAEALIVKSLRGEVWTRP